MDWLNFEIMDLHGHQSIKQYIYRYYIEDTSMFYNMKTSNDIKIRELYIKINSGIMNNASKFIDFQAI